MAIDVDSCETSRGSTVTSNVAVLVLPSPSVAVAFTVVVPIGNVVAAGHGSVPLGCSRSAPRLRVRSARGEGLRVVHHGTVGTGRQGGQVRDVDPRVDLTVRGLPYRRNVASCQ